MPSASLSVDAPISYHYCHVQDSEPVILQRIANLFRHITHFICSSFSFWFISFIMVQLGNDLLGPAAVLTVQASVGVEFLFLLFLGILAPGPVVEGSILLG